MAAAFSAGIGMAMGLLMGRNMVQAMRPREVVVRQVVICQNCAALNPVENKFCSSCGRSLIPPPQISCQKCEARNPATFNFCGNCGSTLEKQLRS